MAPKCGASDASTNSPIACDQSSSKLRIALFPPYSRNTLTNKQSHRLFSGPEFQSPSAKTGHFSLEQTTGKTGNEDRIECKLGDLLHELVDDLVHAVVVSDALLEHHFVIYQFDLLQSEESYCNPLEIEKFSHR